MKPASTIPQTIGGYIAACPKQVQKTLRMLRKTVKAAAPDAKERISYQMPAFSQNGILVYFAAFKDHIGFFPTSSGVQAFKRDLSAYDCSKGTIRFPLGKPLPLALISKIVKFRVAENAAKTRQGAGRRVHTERSE
jgi:uncharacterized protein YdhG (YjbR/CyaY superfamily)